MFWQMSSESKSKLKKKCFFQNPMQEKLVEHHLGLPTVVVSGNRRRRGVRASPLSPYWVWDRAGKGRQVHSCRKG